MPLSKRAHDLGLVNNKRWIRTTLLYEMANKLKACSNQMLQG